MHSDAGASADSAWLDELPAEDNRTLTDNHNAATSVVSARVLCAEVFELHGRPEDAIRFAQAECADPLVFNGPSISRAGRALGRCHAALGQSSLSVAAVGSALEMARTGRYLASASLTERTREAALLMGGGGGLNPI